MRFSHVELMLSLERLAAQRHLSDADWESTAPNLSTAPTTVPSTVWSTSGMVTPASGETPGTPDGYWEAYWAERALEIFQDPVTGLFWSWNIQTEEAFWIGTVYWCPSGIR